VSESPTAEEIHAIESAVKMPKGTRPLNDYVRYYYANTDSGSVKGMYVAKWILASEKVSFPSTGVVVVKDLGEIPAPWDSGCDVVTVFYAPSNPSHISASCDSQLSIFDINPQKVITAFFIATAILLVAIYGFRAILRRLTHTR
jgi:hypothetical protein